MMKLILPSAIAVLLVFCAFSTVEAVDPLDFLFSSSMVHYPRYRTRSSAAVTPDLAKRAPPGCICTEFLGCHGPGCMRRAYRERIPAF
ncbi:hypothetical protein L5515_010699 [Caenorhabditis briggsae]|uniref:Uncharacterized protein n=2 Tax=Caenorhabditis briggsae TaxID=6238 RepID=A0AAE9D3V2_CAEBR|nr:hypothetical protein L3Y34_003545 [Caenorhabditis briggsae]UMM27390.1 hypothetical protein L5515_010699 [Caenorhabditis briggsae]